MKLTSKQENELKIWGYFMPLELKKIPRNDSDLKKFFEWSERGMHKDEVSVGGIAGHSDNSYFKALREGKSWAGVHMGMWEEGVLEGSIPYFNLVGGYEGGYVWYWNIAFKLLPFEWVLWLIGKTDIPTFKHAPIPRPVVEFMKKEMFKGIDSDAIEKVYQSIL